MKKDLYIEEKVWNGREWLTRKQMWEEMRKYRPTKADLALLNQKLLRMLPEAKEQFRRHTSDGGAGLTVNGC